MRDKMSNDFNTYLKLLTENSMPEIDIEIENVSDPLLDELVQLAEKLDSYRAPSTMNPTQAFGYEQGMMNAAEMINNIIKKYRDMP